MKKVCYLLLSALVSGSTLAQSHPAGTDFRHYGNTSWIAAGNDPAQMKSVPLPATSRATTDADYTQGVFMVNEEWYGHQNGSVNFLTSQGEWIYNVFQKENPGRELGCTTQFGTIYGDKIYLVSKQPKDPGTNVMGSRFTVCDAKTMQVIKEFEFIASKTVVGKQGQDSLVSIADGRSYLPVDEQKGYIGTSNGIFLYDSDKMTIGKQIKGTGNPNDEGYGQLYYAQIGTMLRANDYVFAVHQQAGLLVIDPKTDQVVRTLAAPVETELVSGKKEEVQRGFGSIVMSKDGNLWISLAKNTMGDGSALNYMLKLNPYTFEVDTIPFPTNEGIEGIPNSWYAWTADGFCASAKENKIYWNGYGTGSWFTGFKIFCYDIDQQKFSLVTDISKLPGNWRLYGTGFRIHPATDELYCSLYHQFNDPNYELVRFSSKGKLLQEYPMIVNYWFPAMPVFPDNAAPIISPAFPSTVQLTAKAPVYKRWLGNLATDADNMDAAIVKTVSEITPDSPFEAIVRNDSLIIGVSTPAATGSRATITVQFNSNGKLITKEITVTSDEIETATEQIAAAKVSIYPNPATDYVTVEAESLSRAEVYSLGGVKVIDRPLTSAASLDIRHLPAGIYFIKITAAGNQTTKKLIKR